MNEWGRKRGCIFLWFLKTTTYKSEAYDTEINDIYKNKNKRLLDRELIKTKF